MSCSDRPKTMRTLLLHLVLWLALCAPAAHAADGLGIVIVSARGGNVSTLDRAAAQQLYLGQRNQLAEGRALTVVDLPASPVRDAFYLRLTGKNPSQIRAYWSRLVFTGRARPPREAASPEDAITIVLANPDAIAYLPSDAATHPGLDVLLRID